MKYEIWRSSVRWYVQSYEESTKLRVCIHYHLHYRLFDRNVNYMIFGKIRLIDVHSRLVPMLRISRISEYLKPHVAC